MPNDTEPNDTDWIDELYAEGADQQPPEDLDAAILTTARRAVRPWYRRPRNLASLATAASLVVAAMVVVLAPSEEALQVPSASPEPAADQRMQPKPQLEVEGVLPMESELRDVPERAVPGTFEADEPAAALVPDTTTGRIAAPASPAGTFEVPAQKQATSAELQPSGWSQASPAPAQCGELPGTETTRRFARDATGVYLVVTEADRLSYWRCETDRWSEVEQPVAEAADSGQQQPDAGDNQ